jgi:hypothetical protein
MNSKTISIACFIFSQYFYSPLFCVFTRHNLIQVRVHTRVVSSFDHESISSFFSFSPMYNSMSNTSPSMVFSWAVENSHKKKCMCEGTTHSLLPSSIHLHTGFTLFSFSRSIWICMGTQNEFIWRGTEQCILTDRVTWFLPLLMQMLMMVVVKQKEWLS